MAFHVWVAQRAWCVGQEECYLAAGVRNAAEWIALVVRVLRVGPAHRPTPTVRQHPQNGLNCPLHSRSSDETLRVVDPVGGMLSRLLLRHWRAIHQAPQCCGEMGRRSRDEPASQGVKEGGLVLGVAPAVISGVQVRDELQGVRQR